MQWFLVAWDDSICDIPCLDICLASQLTKCKSHWPILSFAKLFGSMSTGFGTKGGRNRAHCAVSVVACEKVKTQGMFGPVWPCVPGCDFDVVILSDPWLRLFVGFQFYTHYLNYLSLFYYFDRHMGPHSAVFALMRAVSWRPRCTEVGLSHRYPSSWKWIAIDCEKGPRRHSTCTILYHMWFSHVFMFSLPNWPIWLPCTSKLHPGRGQYARVWIHWRQQRCLDEAQAVEPAQAHASAYDITL